MGNITKKYSSPIINGEIKLPNIIPKFIQIIFNGVNNPEFNRPSTKNIKLTIKLQIIISYLLRINGYKVIIKKIIKNNIPKALFDFNLVLSLKLYTSNNKILLQNYFIGHNCSNCFI